MVCVDYASCTYHVIWDLLRMRNRGRKSQYPESIDKLTTRNLVRITSGQTFVPAYLMPVDADGEEAGVVPLLDHQVGDLRLVALLQFLE